jgi:predicted nucleic acid-binding protein
MPELLVLDTDMDSRLSEPELSAWAQGWLARQNLLAVTAPTIIERRYGYQAAFQDWERAWDLYREILTARTIEVLPLDLGAAEIVGHLRVVCPAAPETRRRRKLRRGSKAARRVSWILDILIAAIAARNGGRLFTGNESDFALLAENLPRPYRLRLNVYPSLP